MNIPFKDYKLEDCIKDAENGNSYAQYNLGIFFWHGENAEPDYKKAMKWFNKAVLNNSKLPYYLMGLAYFNGLGVKANFKKSYKCFYESAKLDKHRDAYLKLGKACEIGLGIKQDYYKAKYWYELAANKGYGPSFLALGLLFQNINCPFANVVTSFTWMLEAAKQNNIEAQVRISLKYKNGEGVEHNIDKSIYWLDKSATSESSEIKHLFYRISNYDYNDLTCLNEFLTNNEISSIIKDFKST